MKSPFIFFLLFFSFYFLDAQHPTVFLEDVFDQSWFVENNIVGLASQMNPKQEAIFTSKETSNYNFIKGIKTSKKSKSVTINGNQIIEKMGRDGSILLTYSLHPKSCLLTHSTINSVTKNYFYDKGLRLDYMLLKAGSFKDPSTKEMIHNNQLVDFQLNHKGQLSKKLIYRLNQKINNGIFNFAALRAMASTPQTTWSYFYDQQNRVQKIKIEGSTLYGKNSTTIITIEYDAHNFPVEMIEYKNSVEQQNIRSKRNFQYTKGKL